MDILNELEAAAQIVLASSNTVSDAQRQSAEKIFLNFRKTKSPYQLCQHILEQSSVDYVLFECIGLLKAALIQEWATLSQTDINSLRHYLIQYIINKPTIAPFVREKILQVISLMTKRICVQDKGESRQAFLGEIEKLIINGDISKKIVGCNMISSLMQEYAATFKSSDIGLSWEVHHKEKKRFESSDLRRIFKFFIQYLKEIMGKPIDDVSFPLVKQVIAIVEGVLTWTFLHANVPKYIIGIFEDKHETGESLPLKLTSQWRDIIMNTDTLDLFFTMYWTVRNNEQLLHYARNCIVQLSSLSGEIVSTIDLKFGYLCNYIQRFMNLLDHISITEKEAIGIATIPKNLVTNFRQRMIHLDNNVLEMFFKHLSRVTCLFIENAAREEALCSDEHYFMDALEIIFEMWLSVTLDTELLTKEIREYVSLEIFNTYVRYHLYQPDGFRSLSKTLDEEEIGSDEEDDKIKYKDQLQTVGNFGRQVVQHTLPLLTNLLEDRIRKLHNELSKISMNSNHLNGSSTQMNTLYEDLHWLILITGNVLCLDSEGETAMIPVEIMKYSMDMSRQHPNFNSAVEYSSMIRNNSFNTNIPENSMDHVIRVASAIFRLCDIEKGAILARIQHALSPELSTTIIWFLKRWSLGYLLIKENYYSEISTNILQAFGEDSDDSKYIVGLILDKIESNLTVFQAEPLLLTETISLLVALAGCSKKALFIMKNDKFGSIISLSTKKCYNFPPTVKRGLMKAIVQVGEWTNMNDVEMGQQYWNGTIKPLQLQFKQLITNPTFNQSYHQEDIRIQIVEIIELFIGILQGVNNRVTNDISELTYPVLYELPNLLILYRSYEQIVQLILELFCECTKGLLCYANDSDSVKIYEICARAIQAYAQCNLNKLTTDRTAEEDRYQSVLLLIQLLINLLSKNLFHHIRSDNTEVDSSSTVANIFLHGLTMILSLMNSEMLKIPSLCLQYFKMITFFCEIYPGKLYTISSELLQQLFLSVELGLSLSPDVAGLCCDIIQVVAENVYGGIVERQMRNEMLVPFMSLLMNNILTQPMNPELFMNASKSLFYLICCYPEQYRLLVSNILADQLDQQAAERLQNEFLELTSNVQMNIKNDDASKFVDNIKKFVVNVRGFLIIK